MSDELAIAVLRKVLNAADELRVYPDGDYYLNFDWSGVQLTEEEFDYLQSFGVEVGR